MIDLVHFCTRLSAACSDDSLKAVRLLPHEIAVYLSAESLPRAVHTLRNEFGAIFVDLFGVDRRSSYNVYQFHLIFALDSEQTWLHLNADLDERDPSFPGLADELPATGWYEREIWEELGLTPRGHPMLRRLRLPPDWPAEVHPRTQTFNWGQQVEAAEPRYFHLEPAPAGVVDYPLGPVRSGIVESGHYTLRTVGEEIVDMYLQLFYKHRGIEKRAEGLPIEFVPLVAERISGTSAFAHSLAFCQAVENLVEVEIPPRARYLRTLLAELERLYNHLGYQSDLCQATGLTVAQAQFDILKERALRLNAAISGHRYLFGMNVPGGLSRNLTEQQQKAVHDLVVMLRHDLETLQKLLSASSSHRDRLENTGILSPREAQAYCAVGPIGRASGIDRDLRRDHPYAAYADIDFDIPVLQEGDAMARSHIRLEETTQSLRIIEQALERLPWGAVHIPIRPLLPGESASGWVESARGECVHWLLVGEDGTLQHYRVRPASFANWQAFSIAIPGQNILTDFPIIEQSFGLSYAGADR
ncbi:MAG TPA: NADH-quinone oxidoreductase subunit C [Ktedonobacteraceae bacterium]|nr:NADH-quinone oxidoreductase subunit C [Ktedonobacteraceae bacterium]